MTALTRVACNRTLGISSLGWLEVRTILAKLHFSYDLELVDKEVDWHRDSRMHTLWNKPKMRVKVVRRKVGCR